MSSRSHRRTANGASPLLIVLIVMTVIAVIMTVWALRLQDNVSDLESDLAAVRSQANASLYQFEPSDMAPAGVSGQAWISPSGSGVIALNGLPRPGDNEVFQVWFITAGSETPMSGGTLNSTEANQGFAIIPADVDGLTTISVSIEPDGGSESPSGTPLLTVDLPGGRG